MTVLTVVVLAIFVATLALIGAQIHQDKEAERQWWIEKEYKDAVKFIEEECQ